MAKLTILRFPDERLRLKARTVDSFDDELSKFVDDMLETMYYENGIGLAATQVGSDKRLMVVDISEHKDAPMCFINPQITKRDGETSMTEGCLSVPNFTADVKRALRISVSALDRNGKPFELDAEDLLAICIQHEIDHLNGVLFIDHLSELRRRMFLDALRKNKGAPKRRPDSKRLEYLAQWNKLSDDSERPTGNQTSETTN